MEALTSPYYVGSIGKREDDMKERLVHEMAEAIAAGQAVFFIGAGFSKMANAPTWDQLVAPLKRDLMPPTNEKNPLLIAQFYENQYSANQLHRALQSTLNAVRLRPTAAHEALCSMPVPVFVTTNYDDLLETQMHQLGRPYNVVMNENDLALWDEKRVQILKLHGDLRSARSIVLTHWDYVRFMNDRPLTKKKLSELFCYRTVIFLGYSLRDPDVSFIFNEISYQLGDLKRPAYIVTHETDPHQHDEWERRGVRALCLSLPEDEARTPSEPPLAGSDAAAGSERGADEQARLNKLMTDSLTTLLEELSHEVQATNHSIMVVDDDALLVELYKGWLTTGIERAKIYTARHGLAAMYALGKVRPRLLIVDLTMPELAGWELIDMIRQFPELEAMSIIIVSGEDGCDQARMARLDVDCFMTKPVSRDTLVAKARELLDAKSQNCVRTRSDIPPRYPATRMVSESSFPPRNSEVGGAT